MLPSEAFRHVNDLEIAVNGAVDLVGHEVTNYDAGFRKENCCRYPLFYEQHVWCKTSIYCKYPGITDLRKQLRELSPVELRKIAEVAWGVTSKENGEELINAIVDTFVQQELSADFEASLEFANKDKLESLYKLLSTRSDIKQDIQQEHLVGLLKSESQWLAVKDWVELFRKRIQGRSKKGLEELCQEQKESMDECSLHCVEVLAAYLYTGPCFMAYNGIYRKFPASIMELLKGNDATSTPDNTMATTLFCLSSALLKLGRHTKLPEDCKVYRGMGAIHLPSQFGCPRGKQNGKEALSER